MDDAQVAALDSLWSFKTKAKDGAFALAAKRDSRKLAISIAFEKAVAATCAVASNELEDVVKSTLKITTNEEALRVSDIAHQGEAHEQDALAALT